MHYHNMYEIIFRCLDPIDAGVKRIFVYGYSERVRDVADRGVSIGWMRGTMMDEMRNIRRKERQHGN